MSEKTALPAPSPSIAMWGSASSGKTTFLASLQMALLRQDRDWQIQGNNEASAHALIRYLDMLTNDHRFPGATSEPESYQWSLTGPLERKMPVLRRLGRRRTKHYVRINLNLVDAPGQFDYSHDAGFRQRDRVINGLTQSDGIIFLFDPVTEMANGHAFNSIFGVLMQMTQRMRDYPGEKLPHYISICITKFDDAAVYMSAEKLKVLHYHSELGYPQVSENNARELFTSLCNLSKSGDGDLLLPLLMRTFHEDRVRFFATSAIGFYIDPDTKKFDPDDFQNSVWTDGGRSMIRGSIYPINVLEPVLWVATSLARA